MYVLRGAEVVWLFGGEHEKGSELGLGLSGDGGDGGDGERSGEGEGESAKLVWFPSVLAIFEWVWLKICLKVLMNEEQGLGLSFIERDEGCWVLRRRRIDWVKREEWREKRERMMV